MNRTAVEDGVDRARHPSSGSDYDHVGRRLRTLEQCALHKRTLRLSCPECGHVRTLDAVSLWWLFQKRGWEDTLSAAFSRLYCSACRTRDGSTARPRIAVGRDPPTGEPLPYPDAATWKRLVSRYRS